MLTYKISVTNSFFKCPSVKGLIVLLVNSVMLGEKKIPGSWALRHTLVIPAAGRLKNGGYEFEASLLVWQNSIST